jgi:NAD(P)H-dependent FMN reductase
MPRPIALFASSRRHGNTGQFMDRVAAQLGIGVTDLGTLSFSPYDYQHRNRGDDFEPLMMRVLEHDAIIFASPVYWYAVSPPMKAFLDRISDFLDLDDLLDHGRRLRGKTGYVLCTSIYEEPPKPFVGSFTDTFDYLGMQFGGIAHVNCRDGYDPTRHDAVALDFASLLIGR